MLHIYTHTCQHTYIHTQTDSASSHTNTPSCSHTHTHEYIHTYIHTYIHKQTRPLHTPTHPLAQVSSTHPRLRRHRTQLQAVGIRRHLIRGKCIIHTYIHTYIHKHSLAHTYIHLHAFHCTQLQAVGIRRHLIRGKCIIHTYIPVQGKFILHACIYAYIHTHTGAGRLHKQPRHVACRRLPPIPPQETHNTQLSPSTHTKPYTHTYIHTYIHTGAGRLHKHPRHVACRRLQETLNSHPPHPRSQQAWTSPMAESHLLACMYLGLLEVVKAPEEDAAGMVVKMAHSLPGEAR
jgi:hypothetical protein